MMNNCGVYAGHNVDAIDALTLIVPVIIMYSEAPAEIRNKAIIECINITRKTRALDSYAVAFSDLLVDVLHGKDLREAVEECGRKLGQR
jgi:hypothetical protein